MIAALIAAAALTTAQTEAGAEAEADRRMADLQLIYSQSCEVRAYATFDRMCESLKRQLREAEKTYRQTARARPPAGTKAAPALALTGPSAEPSASRD